METATKDDLIQQLQERKATYDLLALLFRTEVTQEVLDLLRQEGALSADQPNMAKGINLMTGYLRSSEASVLDLARDYAKTFCGAASTHKTSAYPFESVYTSKDGMLMQEARDGALKWYHAFGLGKNHAWQDCEDHVALELEFASYLLGQTVEALLAGDESQAAYYAASHRDFTNEHLANWIFEFARHVQLRARTDFYKGLAVLLAAFIEQDVSAAAALSELLGEPKLDQACAS